MSSKVRLPRQWQPLVLVVIYRTSRRSMREEERSGLRQVVKDMLEDLGVVDPNKLLAELDRQVSDSFSRIQELIADALDEA